MNKKNINTQKDKSIKIVIKKKHAQRPVLNHLTGPQYKIVYLPNATLKTRSISGCFILTKDNII